MAAPALVGGSIASLRHQIAKIEGRPAEMLDGGVREAIYLRRRSGMPQENRLSTGAQRFDAALAGGLPAAGLSEIHAAGTYDVAAASAFALAVACRRTEETSLPFLWIGTSENFREAGCPYPPGIFFLHGIHPSRLLVARAARLVDALWIAEQAAALDGFCAILLETRGMSARLDITATRRLHRRALQAGRPLFLLRHAARPEPTAAPFRLIVRSAPAGRRHVLGKPVPHSIGPPAFHVEIGKSPIAPPSCFTLEWNAHERVFHERAQENPVAVVSISPDGTRAAPATGTLLAFPSPARQAAADRQPAGKQHSAHRRAG